MPMIIFGHMKLFFYNICKDSPLQYFDFPKGGKIALKIKH